MREGDAGFEEMIFRIIGVPDEKGCKKIGASAVWFHTAIELEITL